nr:MAG TPA: hypothetical protein [Caudoviricetes sp.]
MPQVREKPLTQCEGLRRYLRYACLRNYIARPR